MFKHVNCVSVAISLIKIGKKTTLCAEDSNQHSSSPKISVGKLSVSWIVGSIIETLLFEYSIYVEESVWLFAKKIMFK